MSESTSLSNKFVSSQKELNLNRRLFLLLFIHYRNREQKKSSINYEIPPLHETSTFDPVDSDYNYIEPTRNEFSEFSFDTFETYYPRWTEVKQIIEQKFNPFPLCHTYVNQNQDILIAIDIEFIKSIPTQSGSEKFLIFQEPIVFSERLFVNLKPISWSLNKERN